MAPISSTLSPLERTRSWPSAISREAHICRKHRDTWWAITLSATLNSQLSAQMPVLFPRVLSSLPQTHPSFPFWQSCCQTRTKHMSWQACLRTGFTKAWARELWKHRRAYLRSLMATTPPNRPRNCDSWYFVHPTNVYGALTLFHALCSRLKGQQWLKQTRFLLSETTV